MTPLRLRDLDHRDAWDHLLLTRRQFLRRLGLATGVVATLSPLTALSAVPNPPKRLRVVIVGAGLAGLCAAYELEQRGHEVVLLEADARHSGGRVRTMRFEGGLYGEFGAMRIPLAHTLTRHYVAQFGLPLRPFMHANPEAFYHVRGQRVRIREEHRLNQFYDLPPAEASKTPLDFFNGTVGALLQELSPEERADLHRVTLQTARVRELDQLSLEAVLKRGGLSSEAIDFMAVTLAYETSLTTAITETLREEDRETWSQQFHEIEGGMDRLPAAFAQRLRSKPLLGCRVTRVEQDLLKRRAAAVYTVSGQQRRAEGDVLLCTLPLGVLSRVQVEPPLSGPKQRAIRQVTYDSSTKVLAVANRRFWETDEGIYGGGTYTDLPTAITYYPSDNAIAKDPAVSRGPGVMLASYTWGQPARRLAALSHAERSEVVIRHLANVHPQLLRPDVVRRVASWSWDNHPLSSGAFCWFAPGQHDTLYQHLVEPEGQLFFAGEHASLTHTWMQGALESGLRAVTQILAAGHR